MLVMRRHRLGAVLLTLEQAQLTIVGQWTGDVRDKVVTYEIVPNGDLFSVYRSHEVARGRHPEVLRQSIRKSKETDDSAGDVTYYLRLEK